MTLRRSIALTVSSKYLSLIFGLVSSVVLARLLTPEDFGIYSIAASIALIGYLLRNFGVGQFIIQADDLSDDKLRTAFSVTLGLSWGIALLLAASSPWIGDFYENPGAAEVLLFLSINFVMLPFGSISEAMLRRKLAFDKLAIITITSSFAGMAVGIGSAWLGAGYLAIVWATNVSTLVTILLTLWYRPPGLPWRPGLGAFREVSGFGLKVGFLDLVMRGGDSATELMIGKVHGLADLGMYSRAYGAYSLFEYAFIEGIRPVVLPFLSEARRNESAVQPLYLQIVAFVSVFMTPFFAFLMVNADDVIRVLYGDQWQAAVPVLQVMCIAGLFLAPTVYFDQLLIAHSRPGLALRYQMLFQAARIGALALLLGDQLALAAVALVVGSVVKLGTAVVLARRLFEVQTASLLATMLPALAIGALALPALWFCSDAIQHWNSAFLRLLVCGSLFGAIWLGGIYLFRHPVTLEINKLVSRLKPA